MVRLFSIINGMENPCLKRSYLERLSSGELVKLADSYGIDIPPGLDRIFIIKELLELGYEGELNAPDAPFLLREQDPMEPAPLPKHYNVTFIDVLLRDPLWAFAFWGIKSHDKEVYEKAGDFGGYYLKVIPLAHDKSPREDAPFIIPVGAKDSSWYIAFPPQGGRFKVGFCVTRGGCEVSLALSLPFRIPVFLNLPEGEYEKNRKNPLACLSGLDDFPVLRNTDRLSRIPRYMSS
jgi:hypothetical protein